MPHPVKDVRVLSRITTEALTSVVKPFVTASATCLASRVNRNGDRPGDASGKYLCRAICQMANYLAENAPLQES